MKRLLTITWLTVLCIAGVAQNTLVNRTATTTASRTDILYIVRDPSGSPVDRKMTVDDFFVSQRGAKSVLAYASLSAAVSAISTTQATVEIPTTTTVSASLTVPSNITLEVIGTGQLSVSSGQTLTINGPIVAPYRQIFTGSGSVVVSKQTVVPHWYGAQVAGRVVTDGSISASGTTLTSATAAFTSSMVGWLIDLEGSGASAADINGQTTRNNQAGTISAYISATQVTVSFTATATVSGKQVTFGPDDTSPLTKALASGNTIYFPPGNYVHSTAFSLSSNRTIYGEGTGVSILTQVGPTRTTAGGINTFTIGDAVQNINIHDLTIKGTNVNGAGATTTVTSFGIRISTGNGGAINNITVQNCEIGNLWGMGIRTEGDVGDQAGSTPTNNNFKFLDLYVHHCSDNGLNPNTGGGLIIRGCTLVDNGAGGIEFAGSRVLITQNYIARNVQAGIALGGLGNPALGKDVVCTNNVIERNGISGNAGKGIQVGGNVVHAVIANNVIKENTYQGIGLTDGTADFASLSRDIQVSHNIVASNGVAASGPGFGIVVSMNNVVVEDNDVFDDAASGYDQNFGIIVAGDSVKLIHNRLRGHTTSDYEITTATNILIVRDDTTSVIRQLEGSGYTGTVDTSSTTVTRKTGQLFLASWVGTIIKIASAYYYVSAVAAAPTGTFTVSGLTVTRSTGTNFDSAWVGQYIKLGSLYFPISAVADASHLTITNAIGNTVPSSGTWTLSTSWGLDGSVSMTIGTSAGSQTGATYIIPPHVVYPVDNSVAQTVPFNGGTPVFDAAQGNIFKITLTGNVSSSTLVNGVEGQIVTFMISQDGTGSRTFSAPSACSSFTTIGSTASKVNIQAFRKMGSTFYPIAAGVTNQ